MKVVPGELSQKREQSRVTLGGAVLKGSCQINAQPRVGDFALFRDDDSVWDGVLIAGGLQSPWAGDGGFEGIVGEV